MEQERKSKTIGVAKKFLIFSIGPILGSIFSLISVPLCTHFLFPDEYGKTSMFNLLYNALVMITYLGYDQAYIREYHEHEDKRSVLLNSLIVPFIATFVVAISVIPFSANISYFLFETYDHPEVVYMLTLALPLILVERYILLNLRMKEKALEYSIYSLLLKIVTFLVTLYYLFNIRRDYLSIVYSILIAHYITDGILLIIYHNIFRFKRNMLDLELIKTMTKFALPLIPATIIGTIFNGQDKIFLKFMSDYSELGYYQVAMSLAGMIMIVQQAFSTFWIPLSYKWKAENEEEEKFEFMQQGVCFVACVVFMGVLLVKDILPIVLSENYYNTVHILPFLLFYPVMALMMSTTSIGIEFARKTKYSLYFSAAAMILNFVLNFCLIPNFGAIGAAIATGLSHIFYFWSKTIYSRKLWFDFKIDYIIKSTIALLIAAILNSVEHMPSIIVNSGNVIIIIFGLLIYKDFIINLIFFVKEWRK